MTGVEAGNDERQSGCELGVEMDSDISRTEDHLLDKVLSSGDTGSVLNFTEVGEILICESSGVRIVGKDER